MLVAIILLCHLSVQLLPATGKPVTSSAATTYNGTFISLEAWHAESLTNISWSFPGTASAGPRDRIIVFWDNLRTDLLRFGNVNGTNRSSASSSSSSSSSSSTDEEYSIFPDGMGAGSDVCNFSAYVVDPLFPFDNENRSSQTTVELLNKSTWWYTSTRGQDANAASNSTASETGTAVVLLGDPGFYIACLVLGDEDCSAADCLEFQVYQPHYDILQVNSTNIGTVLTVRFNVASFDATLGDWGWILGGVDPELTVADANALSSGEIFNQFSEGCWFYFGRAVTLGHPFLCSRDPNSELASLQASTADDVYQYGWFEIYSAASGNSSIWYAVDEDYDFAMVHTYYTCGVDIISPVSSVVSTTGDVVIVGVVEEGAHCGLGDGIPLRIRTVAVTFPYFDVPSSVVFWGQMDSMSTSNTLLSVRLPVTGPHSVLVELESGGVLASLNMTATSGEPYAPTSVVETTFPTSIRMYASVNVSFTSRDFYRNDITIGYGDGAFEAWTTSSMSHKVKEAVHDLGDGSYRVEMNAQNEAGTGLFFVQRNGLNIPGSPFEAYVVGSAQCVIESLDIKVGECTDDLYRTVVHEWKEGTICEGGLALPTNTRVPCSYIPASSILGRAMVVASVCGAIYSAFYLVWITRHRECAIVQLSQPFVCKLFLTGCILLNLTGPLFLGEPSSLVCHARPVLMHTALTFASSCLYMKTYRVHRLFNTVSLVRMSISDRNLVVWVLRLVSVDVVILTLWMILDGPHKGMTREVYGYAEVLSPVCAPGSRYFSTILWAYKGALNAFGVVMAAKTWNCADGVGESQSICLSVYNTTLLGLVNLVLHLLVSEHPMATICARSFAAVGGTVFTVSVMFGPKVYKLYYFGDLRSTMSEGNTLSGRKNMTTTRRSSGSIRGDIPVSCSGSVRKKTRVRTKPYRQHRNGRINPIELTDTTHVPHSMEPLENAMEPTTHSMESTAHPMERAGKLPPIPGILKSKEKSVSSSIDDRF